MTTGDGRQISAGYCELAVTSNFSFLRGASHPEELVTTAKSLGISGISLTDRNSLAGVVRAHVVAKHQGMAYAPGCRLVFMDATPDILVWPPDRAAYAKLCELLTLGKRRAPKGACHLQLEDLVAQGRGLIAAIVPGTAPPQIVAQTLGTLAAPFKGALYMGLSRHFGPDDDRDMAESAQLAKSFGLPLVALGDVLYHHPDRRPLQDVLTCIREHETLKSIGTRLNANAERHLRAPQTLLRLFAGYEHALAETAKLFARLEFSLDELAHQYPDDPVFEELGNRPLASQEALNQLVTRRLAQRFPKGATPKVLANLEREMGLIEKLGYAPYFLTVYDIVRFARSKGILCQGRGSAANSVVCFCLGITEVDPQKVDLLFERFISEERNEPPDIDVDFEHERREEVIQYIYQKYGRERAGLAATVITYRSRSAVREVAKVFSYSEDVVTALSATRWGSSSRGLSVEHAQKAGLDAGDKHLRQMLDLAAQIVGFPRHLSQHVGGFVITRDRLSSLIPIENAAMDDRTIVEWDKDDLDNLGMLKIDVLALGMLTCLRECFALLDTHYNRHETLASLPDEDVATYDMICRADTVGVFQIESRAQMSMLPRLRPRSYYDLVIEVAIVRPGPIQGDMVHPYLRRRQGLEPVNLPSPELAGVLGKTLGIPLFQEQAMNIAIVAADFAPGEADRLRRAMATFRRVGTISTFRDKMVEGMVKKGYEREFAEYCFRQIEGFGEYGFPESHAASFALLVYASCWLKCHYPDVFLAAMLNAQPLGFYAPAQLVRDAREHGVEVRPVDINHSLWQAKLEPEAERCPIAPQHGEMAGVTKNSHAVRLGLSRIKGLREVDAEKIIAHRGQGYDSVYDVWVRASLSRRTLELLARADSFGSLGLDRRTALWAVRALDPLKDATHLPLLAHAGVHGHEHEPGVSLPPMPLGSHVVHDYRTLSLSLKAHPIGFVRDALEAKRYAACARLREAASGRMIATAGLVLVRQRPGTASGVIFMTLEDETGVANIIVWPKVFEKYRRTVLGARCIGVYGRLQKEQEVVHLVANRLEDLTGLLDTLEEKGPVSSNPADARPPSPPANAARHPRKANVWPRGRNFH